MILIELSIAVSFKSDELGILEMFLIESNCNIKWENHFENICSSISNMIKLLLGN